PAGAGGARALAASHPPPLRHGAAPGGAARGLEPHARGARRGGGGARGEAAAPQALLLPAARGAHPRGRRRRSAREPPPRHHRRVPRPARLHAVRRERGARGGDDRARRVPRRDGTPRARIPGHARALHRRRPHGVLQRPAADPAAGAARGGDGVRDAGGCPQARRAMEAARLRPRIGHRHRAGICDGRRHRLRGAHRLRGDRHRHEPGEPPVRPRRAGQHPGVAKRARRGGRARARGRPRRGAAARVQAGGARVSPPRPARRGGRGVKQSNVRARIRQLCCLGLPGEMLVGSLLTALRELVPSESAAFFWVDARGEMRNLYAERLLPPQLMSLYFERYYDGAESSFRKAFRERAAAPDGVVATSPDAELRKTGYYNEIMRRLDAHHVLYGIVREQGAALGQLSLYRPQEAPAFGPRERSDLASVMRYISHGIAVGDTVDGTGLALRDSDDEALLVCDRRGRIRHGSEKARRLLLLATTSEINPATLNAAVNERAAQALRVLCERLEAIARGEDSSPPMLTLDTRWGRHVVRAYWLDDDHASPEALVGIRIQRQEPMILRFVEAMGRLPLSPQQREIALMIAQGRSNQEIADDLGVSGNTVAYHIKQLFLKLDVHDRAGAVERIAAGTALARGMRPADQRRTASRNSARGEDSCGTS